MKLYKKGDGLTLNVIIIAVLALIVLVVLIVIFSGKIKIFGQGTENCASLGGQCTQSQQDSTCIQLGTCSCPDTMTNAVVIKGTDCEKNLRVCCKSIY